MKLDTHLVVFVAATKADENRWKSWRHLGTGFHIGDAGSVATCKHIVNSLLDGESLFAFAVTGSQLVMPVYDIRCHPKYDFAVVRVDRPDPVAFSIIYSGTRLYIGDDVIAYGYFGVPGSHDCIPKLVGRCFKGHVVRIDSTIIPNIAASTCEISFPSISGFSESPILHKRDCVLGMFHGNHESSIQVYQYEEVLSTKEKHVESVRRVIELGLAHTAMGIRAYLKDLGVTNIPVGPTDAQLNQWIPL